MRLLRGLATSVLRRLHTTNSIPSKVATSDLPLALVLKAKGHADAYEEIINSYKNKLTIIEREATENVTDLAKDQCMKVQGLAITGFAFPITGKIMDSFPNLRVISAASSGVNYIEVEEARKRGIKIGHTPIVGECVADFVFALLLASARNVVEGDRISRHPNFSRVDYFWFGVEVSGSTIGIVGFGNTGSAVAKRAKGFNMNILYHTRTRKYDLEKETGAQYCNQLHDLVKQADFLVVCVPLSPQTKYLISASEMSIMKPSATIINIARGDVVNQDDLVKALQTGQIRGAAVDVTWPEPLPRDHPLLTLPNVIITPHIGTGAEATRKMSVKLGMDNLVAGVYGKPLLYEY